MKKYHIYEQEAKGKHSLVFKARIRKRLEFVAVKQMPKSRREKLENELKKLSALSHPNILRAY